jgi:hypothetical protein
MLVCAALQVGVLCGVPMRPEQIQELMFQLHQPKLAHVIPDEEGGGDGDGPPPDADSDATHPE